MLTGHFFSYGNVNSEQYQLLLCQVDTTETHKIGGDLSYTHLTTNQGVTDIIYARSKDEVFSFEIEMVKMTNDNVIDFAEHQSICRDFFNSPTFKKLQIMSGEYVGMYLNAYFSEVEVIMSGAGIVGYKATVTCDSYNFWEDHIYTYSKDRINRGLKFLNNTVQSLHTPVDVTFTTGSIGGDCSITRTSVEGKESKVSFTSLPPNVVVNVLYNPQHIEVSNAEYQKEVYKANGLWNKRWLTFTQGMNTLVCSGDIETLTISYKSAKALF